MSKIGFAHTYIPKIHFRASWVILVRRQNGLISTFTRSGKLSKKSEKTCKNPQKHLTFAQTSYII